MHDKIGARQRRGIPPVNAILEALGEYDVPRPLMVDLVRGELARERKARLIASPEAILERIRKGMADLRRSRLQTVINGTGILIHTNLGRAPLAADAAEKVSAIASAYSNLELDLETGSRGRRTPYLERALALLCHAQDATVVNNCAAALVLTVQHLIRKKTEVVISRGEMVQIGGGFRIAEILESVGARLREVGATNKTTLGDYARAIGRDTAVMLRVHRSNFVMSGFVDSPSSAELAGLALKKRIPFVHDLGSGAAVATEQLGLEEHETTPAEAVRDGATLVCFSGDKLLGGPQAGIIAGKARLIAALRREPLFRAFRCDKLVLAGLQATVDLHLTGAAPAEVPVLAMLGTSKDELRSRAAAMLVRLRGLPIQITIGHGAAGIGGGSLAQSAISSLTLDILPEECTVSDFAATLRNSSPPVIGYIARGFFKLDLRTIFPSQDDTVVDAIRLAATKSNRT